MRQWNVDVPDPRDLTGVWVCVGSFDTRKEALDFVVEKIGIARKHASVFITKIES